MAIDQDDPIEFSLYARERFPRAVAALGSKLDDDRLLYGGVAKYGGKAGVIAVTASRLLFQAGTGKGDVAELLVDALPEDPGDVVAGRDRLRVGPWQLKDLEKSTLSEVLCAWVGDALAARPLPEERSAWRVAPPAGTLAFEAWPEQRETTTLSGAVASVLAPVGYVTLEDGRTVPARWSGDGFASLGTQVEITAAAHGDTHLARPLLARETAEVRAS